MQGWGAVLGGGQGTVGSARGSLGAWGLAGDSGHRGDKAGGGGAPKLLFPPLRQRRVLHALQEEAFAFASVECLAEK